MQHKDDSEDTRVTAVGCHGPSVQCGQHAAHGTCISDTVADMTDILISLSEELALR